MSNIRMTPELKKTLRNSISFFENLLLADRPLKYDYTLDLVLIDNVDGHGYLDYDYDETDEENIVDFTIVVNKKWTTRLDMIYTIAHEMVHVSQYLRGRLLPSFRYEGFVWDGVHHITKDEMDHDEYMMLPWEKEAFEMEEALVEEFLKVEHTL